MAKSKKRRFWIIFTVISFVSLIVSLSPLKNSVSALYDRAHSIAVFLRFDSEFLQKTSAGQHYRFLLIKHGEEQYQIVNNHPEHLDEFWRVVQMFTPGVEALVSGQGDTVQITQEQINSLKTEWDWEASFASQSLGDDVEKELERFPLDDFVGMTMSEAWEYVNSNFPPDLTAESINPDLGVTSQVIPTLICLIGLDVSCQEKPLLTSDSQWAYYVHQEVYFEFPSGWQVQYSSFAQIDEFTVLRLPESSGEENIRLLSFTFLDLQNWPIENWDQVLPSLFSQTGCTDTQWEIIHIPSFQGFECFWKDSDSPTGTFRFFLYNENQRIGIDLRANVLDARLLETKDDLNAINKIFPNVQHIIESIRMWEP